MNQSKQENQLKPSKQVRYIEIAKRLNQLTGQKQALFREKLAVQGINSWQLPIVPTTQQQAPLSLAQQRFLVAEQFSQRALYNLCSVLAFDDGLNIQALQQAVNRLLDRHQVMRTCFNQDEQGLWYSQQLNDYQVEIAAQDRILNKSKPSIQTDEQWLEEQFNHELEQSFDLTTQVPFRLTLFANTDSTIDPNSDLDSDLNTDAVTDTKPNNNINSKKIDAAPRYWLFISIHHVAFDAWSFTQFNQDLVQLYSMAVNNSDRQLPPLPIQYQDYALWQHQWLQGDDYIRQQNYWLKQLDDVPQLLTLPIDCPKKLSKNRTFSGAHQQLQLNQLDSENIRQQVATNGQTLYIHLQTAFAWLLAKYSGQNDFCFGSSIANRRREETSTLVGPLLNTLVLRQQLTGDPSFSQSLQKNQIMISEAFDNQDYPFEHLSDLLNIERDQYHSPLFQVMFIHVALPDTGTINLPGTKASIVTPDQQNSRFDITLRVTETGSKNGNNITLDLEYSTELFSEETIAILLNNLASVLQQTTENPNIRLSQIALTHQLSQLSGPQLNDSTLTGQKDLLSNRIAQHPANNIALTDENESVTYGQLNQRVIQLAHYLKKKSQQNLQKQGSQQTIKKHQHVGLCMPRSILQVTTMLACWRLGLTCILLDPKQPIERIENILLNGEATLVLTQQNLPITKTPQLLLTSVMSNLSKAEITSPDIDINVSCQLSPSDSAYIIYTSGSTGQPKGVVISHGALSHYASAISQQYPQENNSVWLTLATVAADLGFTAVLAALHQGQCLLLPPAELAFDPPALAEFIQQHPIDCLKITPSHLAGLLSIAQPEQLLPRRTLFMGGEGLTQELLSQLTQLSPNMTIVNHYGPSEATVGVCCKTLTDFPQESHDENIKNQSIAEGLSHVASLGQPLPGISLSIRDQNDQQVPTGVVGELHISGPQLANEYWQLAEQSQQAFIENNTEKQVERRYKTGDKARFTHQGEVEYLGRFDDQIKRRGFRIELGEITAWLNNQPEVNNAFVLFKIIADQPRPSLIAWLQTEQEDLSAISQRLKSALPDYMIPDHYLCLAALPLNANGKVDRHHLPEPSLEQVDSSTNDTQDLNKTGEPSTTNETILANIWQKLLKIPLVNIEDDFFTLGGDSILTLQMIGLAAQQGLRLSPLDITNYRTLHAIATNIAEPIHPIATQLIQLFSELLQQPSLLKKHNAQNEDFFALGGDSILSLQLIGKARGKGLQITPQLLIENPTPKALAIALSSANAAKANENTIEQANETGAETKKSTDEVWPSVDLTLPQPLSLAQQRIWFIHQLTPKSTSYNLPAAFTISGQLDHQALSASCLALVERHDMLRCRYFEHKDVACQQRIKAYQPLVIHPYTEHWQAAAQACEQRVFDLTTGKLLAIDLFQITNTEYHLLFNIHHIATDGWSMAILVQDFLSLYQHYKQQGLSSKVTDTSTSIINVPINNTPSYLTWAAWQAQQVNLTPNKYDQADKFNKNNNEKLTTYWQKRLTNMPHTLTLPVDHPYPAKQSDLGATKEWTIKPELQNEIERYAKQLKITPFNLYLNAFQLLLWQHTKQTDFAIGVPVSGRDNPTTQQMIGVFINTMISRVNIQTADTANTSKQWLINTANVTQQDLAHQQMPLEQLLALLQPERDLARPAIFQSVFNYQVDQTSQRTLSMPGLAINSVSSEQMSTKFELSFNLMKKDNLSVQIEYNRALFDYSTIERFFNDYSHILQWLTTSQEQPLSNLLLPSTQQAYSNGGNKEIHIEDFFINRFEQQVNVTPSATAVITSIAHNTSNTFISANSATNSSKYSYQQLNHDANQLAHWLIKQGAAPEVLVSFCLPRGYSLIVALLAIQKTGAAYLPLDPIHPQSRLNYIVDHAKPLLCLVDNSTEHVFNQKDNNAENDTGNNADNCSSIKTYHFDALHSALAAEKTSNPQVNRTQNTLAYTLYTSGSTGQPKGVDIECQQFASFLYAIDDVLPEFSRVLALTTITFDIAGLEIALPLSKGQSVVIANEIAQSDPLAIEQLISTHQVDLIQATPATWQMLQQLPSSVLANVHAIAGGEALDSHLAKKLQQSCKSVINVYGPTETTVWSSYYRLNASSNVDVDIHNQQASIFPPARPILPTTPIGQPLLNNQFYVLDENKKPVPTGVIGELYIGGLSVARGYRLQPELNTKSFITLDNYPFDDETLEKTGRVYRTGDRVKWLASGQLYFVGRTDFQVKLRGFRIELGEIESVLLKQTEIATAVVHVNKDHLIAYYTLENMAGGTLDESLIEERLRSELPHYMLPHRYQLMSTLPLNSNGKVDRNALPALTELKQATSLKNNEACNENSNNISNVPLTEREQTLAKIWCELLQREQVNAQDDFFLLGGHSLLVGQLRARLNALGFTVPLIVLFEQPILAKQATLLETSRYQKIPTVVRKALMPLSDAQRRVWFIQQLNTKDNSFNMQTSIRITGDLFIPALEKALETVTQHHEILRVTYHEHQGEAYQRVNPALKAEFLFNDIQQELNTLPALLTQAAQQPFDLQKESPLKIYVYQEDKNKFVCQLIQHHIASDAWSMSLLLDQLMLAYQQIISNQVVSLPINEVNYLDFADWQNSVEIKQLHKKGLHYWQKTLAGCPTQLLLPTDRQRQLNNSKSESSNKNNGDSVTFTVPPALNKQLKALAQQHNCSLFMLLISAYSAFIHGETRCPDMIIGTDVANREHLQTESMLGFFINLIPLRLQPKATQRFSDFLSQNRQTCLDSFNHQNVPFEQIVDIANPERIAAIHPLIQALFVMQNTPSTAHSLTGLSVSAIATKQHSSKFDMALFANEKMANETNQHDELEFNWVFNNQLFDKSTIESFSKHYLRILAAIVEHSEQPLNMLLIKENINTMNKTTNSTMNSENIVENEMDNTSKNTPVKASKLGKLNKLNKLKKTTKNTHSNQTDDVIVKPLQADRPFPLLVECQNQSIDPFTWARKNQAQIMTWLSSHAGIVFRGFNLPTAIEFEQFCVAIYPELYAMYGDLPKNDIGSKIYKSTPYPNDQMIMFHNESSHQHRWPRRQWFYCSQPSTKGGATPIVDCREMYKRLPEHIRTKLEEKHLCYIRNFSGLDVSWQHFFKTEDRKKVEATCQENNIQFSWFGEDNLKISQICPAVITHPITGEKSFFNQIQLHHESFLDNDVREHLIATGGVDNLPRSLCYGDKTPLEQSVIALISELYESCAVRFPWQKQDIVMLDNMLAAHARDPFEGERKIVVAMGDIYHLGATPDATPVSAKLLETPTIEKGVKEVLKEKVKGNKSKTNKQEQH